jgi:hypothetical protein
MPIDSNIALGFRPSTELQIQSPINQMAQLMQLRQAQSQNELAQYQLGATQRAEEQQSNLYNASRKPDFKLDLQTAIQYGPPGIAAYKAQQESAKLQGEVDAQQRKAAADRADAFSTALAPLVVAVKSKKPITHQDVFGQATRLVAQGLLRQEDLAAIPMNADKLPDFVMNMATATENSRKALGLFMPKNVRQEAGGKIVTIQDNPMLEGYGLPIQGMDITKTATISDITGQEQLALARAKFAFEKANPTLSIQEDANGYLAINTRNGVATPVVYGPTGFQAAPAAAPAAAAPSVMRQQGAGMPGQRMPAIPGMTSVLDQTVAPTVMPKPAEGGVRVVGQPVGTRKEAPAKFNDTDMQLAGLAGSLKEFKDEVGKNLFTGAKFVPSGADTARMQAKYTALLMGVKDLYTLGALAGPDMSIIESQLTNPASWSGKFTTKKGFEEQIKVIEDMLKRTTTNLENTYGRVPKASKAALQGLPDGAASGIPNATATNPLGLAIPGVQ